MFHSGDLNSGIAKAIQEKKLVACFVRQDGNERCRVWEEEWLANPVGDDPKALGEVVAGQSVLLRIDHGTKEASFLSAFCPVDQVPTLIVIHNGQVLAQLDNDVGYEEFCRRLLDVLSRARPATGPEEPESSNPEALPGGSPLNRPAAGEPPQNSSSLDQMYAERARRLDTERKAAEAREKLAQQARANARRAHDASGDSKPPGVSEETDKQRARNDWVYQQKQRKEEAKRDRDRVKANIEADKLERKVRAERAKSHQWTSDAEASAASSKIKTPMSSVSSTAPRSCALVIRLFDGASIKGKFASDSDLATAVRTWIKEAVPEGSADRAYTFRQMLPPQPSRSIEVSEEHMSLQELGLAPSATLVLVPVVGGADAYSDTAGGYVDSMFRAASWVGGSAFSAAGAALSYVSGFGSRQSEQPNSGPYMTGTGDPQGDRSASGVSRDVRSANPTSANASMRVQTLADQRAGRRPSQPNEFYNGNSSAFQGRKDEQDQ